MLGTYRTPRVRIGQKVECEVRGPVVVVSLSDTPIQWPLGRSRRGRPSPVIYEDLSRALRQEAAVDICDAFGITAQTVSKWRRLLGIGRHTPGSLERRRQIMLGPHGRKMHRLARPTLQSPIRRAKIAASKLGKKRPEQVVEAMRGRMLGAKLPDEVRRKMSEAHRRRGTRPPKAGKPWTVREGKWLRTLSAAEVAMRTKRTIAAVYCRRQKLRLPDGRTSRPTTT